MKGEWIQAASGTWHLIWLTEDDDGQVISWCNRVFKFDDPRKPGTQIVGYADTLHDECLRKSEELP